jgi:hypothetical protein
LVSILVHFARIFASHFEKSGRGFAGSFFRAFANAAWRQAALAGKEA